MLYSSAALEGGGFVAADSIDDITCTNTSGGVLYFQVFLDVTALPIDTTVPDISIAVPATASVGYDPVGESWRAGRGVAFCLSSTAPTKTIAGSVGFFSVR